MSYRKPPKPEFYYTTEPGTCRWCNEKIGPTRTGRPSKSKWHKTCVEEYNILNSASKSRATTWQRDKGKCAHCNKVCCRSGTTDGWEMDHIVPLIEDHSNIACWKLQNLQTLCIDCHTKKTSQEATDRATRRNQSL